MGSIQGNSNLLMFVREIKKLSQISCSEIIIVYELEIPIQKY